jgi:hypothetical protein
MVRVAGLKAKFLIVTKFDPLTVAVVVGVAVAGFPEEVQPENKQVRTSMIAHADQKILRECEVIVSF